MKKIIPLILAMLFLALLFNSCAEQNQPNLPPTPDSRWEAKNQPNDHELLKKSYPDKYFGLKAYAKGMTQVKNQLLQRSGTGFEGEWEVQGPGNIGARINTVSVHPTDEDIIFVGFARGGIWRTTDGGTNWESVFDEQTALGASDIVFDNNNPDHIWVGTGDVNISGNAFIGDGIYKSEDGGDTWEHKGLLAQRIISKIIIDPVDSDRIYVGTMGLPFERNDDRGLYRTLDGGETWEQILFLSDQAGVVDLVIDPFDPQTLYASGWDRIRNNTESLVRGPHARIYKTTDGGDNWTALEGGLPVEENMGRTGLAISQQTEGLLYSMFVGTNSQLFGVFKSEDAGMTWDSIPIYEGNTGLSGNALGGFGWYFGKIRVNPADDNDIFLLGVDLWRSSVEDEFWFQSTPPWWQYSVHADKHDLIYTNSGAIILATDGGLYRSTDGGNEWEDIENIPTTQFYRVAYNPHNTDWYYGGAQDNGTTGGNSDIINEWPRIWGGDGFQTVFHPDIPEVFYVETQNGNITGTDDGGLGNWFPADDGIEQGDRRNWDMPYSMSNHFSDILYAGTYRMYRSTSGVYPLFTPISDMLTDTIGPPPDRAANHTISTLHESPVSFEIIYVGTTDGNVWRSLDAGGTWENISEGLPKRYVTDVKASPTEENVVYVTHSGYKDNDFIPHIHKSEDNGDTWIDISADLPEIAINDVFILPDHQDSVIFAATDGGVYGTLDGAESWERVGTNMPIVQVNDLELNVAKNEIIAGTFARSIMTYSIDSLLFMTPPDTTTSIANGPFLHQSNLKIYPSPADSEINIELINHEFGKATEIVILDAAGKLVDSQKITQNGVLKVNFDVSKLVSGTYFVKAKTRHQVVSGQFLKM